MKATAEDLLALAARLEASGSGHKLYDAAIRAVAPPWALSDDEHDGAAAPPYTSSLDAAMRLVPPWALWRLRTLWAGAEFDRTACVASVTVYQFPEQTIRFTVEAQARAASLALCAAALRALAEGAAGRIRK